MSLRKLFTATATIATLALTLTVAAPEASPASAAPVVSSTIALPAGSYPASVAFSTAGIGVAKAYVANANDTMSVIFLDSDRDPITFSLPADAGATSVAVIGYDVYVANYRAGTVSVINGGTDSYWRSIALPAGSSPLTVAFSPGGIAYVANGSGDTVSVLGPVSVISTIELPEGSNPASLDFSPDCSKAFVANEGNSTVSVINVATNSVTATIQLPLGSGPRSIALSPDGTKAYVANTYTSTVSVITVATGTVTARISLAPGSFPVSVAFSPSGDKAFVANEEANTVSVISIPSEITSVPRTLRAGTATSASVALSWTVPANLNDGVITDYVVQYRRTGTSRWMTFAHTASAARARTVTGLTARTSYQFQVAAKTAAGTSPVTAAITKTTLAR